MRLSFSHTTPPHRFLQPRGFQALVSGTGTLGYVVCLTLQLFLLVYPHVSVELLGPLASTSPAWSITLSCFFSTLVSHLCAPPKSLDEYFFFNSLVVRLPYNSILWQFWLLLFFNLLLSFFWLCKGAKSNYLCLHLSQKRQQSLQYTVLLLSYQQILTILNKETK